MDIKDYWNLPPKLQGNILASNPKTRCAVCSKDEVKLLSCDACGESMCYECAIPYGSITLTAEGLKEDLEGVVLCKNCLPILL